MSVKHITQSLQSWAAHLSHADSWHLQRDIFENLLFKASFSNPPVTTQVIVLAPNRPHPPTPSPKLGEGESAQSSSPSLGGDLG
jgi:hypothetical protein